MGRRPRRSTTLCGCWKAILAGLPDADLDRRYRDETLPAATTAAALTDRAALRAELARIRDQGYALNWEESADGVCAAALRNTAAKPLAGLGVAAPSSRMGDPDAIRAFAPDVLRAAELVHERLRTPHQ